MPKFVYNPIQLAVRLSSAKHKMIVAGRGVGKTTILADEIYTLSRFMPRGKIGFIGMSYFHAKTKSMPVIINHWERKGLIKDLHYFVGRKPPKAWKWKEAYQPPLDYKNCIIFFNGFTVELISMDRPEMARSGSYDFLIGDEAAKIKEAPLNSDILPANRGNNDRFGHLKRHHGTLWTTTHALSLSGEWIYKYRNLAEENKNYFYLEGSAEANMANLGEDFFRHQKRIMDPATFALEILNKKPTLKTDSFYPTFDIDKHSYNPQYNYAFIDNNPDENFNDSRRDRDINSSKPLDISFDFGSKINCLVVGQETFPKYRILNALFVRQPNVLRDLVQKFINYYRFHENKTIYLYGGSDGRRRSDYDSSLTFFQKIRRQLEQAGWSVIDCFQLTEINYKEKFVFFNELFAEQNPHYPSVAINNDNALSLILSIQNSPLKKNAIEKDKSDEGRDVDQSKTTHFSDTMDNLLYWKYCEKEVGTRAFIPTRLN